MFQESLNKNILPAILMCIRVKRGMWNKAFSGMEIYKDVHGVCQREEYTDKSHV